MKKLIILAGLLLAMAHTAFAEQRGVLMEFHLKSNPEKNSEVNRSSMFLLIDAYSGGYPFSISGDIRSVPS